MLHMSPTARLLPSRTCEPPAQGVLCAGAKSSASTWLYNVVAEILRRRGEAEAWSYVRSDDRATHAPRYVKQFYADSPESFPRFDGHLDTLVIQTQQPSISLSAFAARAEFQVVMTIREPRDAVASLMKRFGFSFSSALEAVTGGDTQIVDLFRSSAPLVLRFEDRFYDREMTIATIAEFLGVDLADHLIREIFSVLTRKQVARKIDEMRREGVFGVLRHDPQTRWQIGHVGEIAIGQHAEILSREQQLLVLSATAGYCAEFGYPVESDDG
jgi:hypothetical protein